MKMVFCNTVQLWRGNFYQVYQSSLDHDDPVIEPSCQTTRDTCRTRWVSCSGSTGCRRSVTPVRTPDWPERSLRVPAETLCEACWSWRRRWAGPTSWSPLADDDSPRHSDGSRAVVQTVRQHEMLAPFDMRRALEQIFFRIEIFLYVSFTSLACINLIGRHIHRNKFCYKLVQNLIESLSLTSLTRSGPQPDVVRLFASLPVLGPSQLLIWLLIGSWTGICHRH